MNLPIEIQNLITNLPVIPFGTGDSRFTEVIMSSEFTKIFEYYMENFSNAKIQNQNPINQRVSLYLALTNQDEEFLNQTNDLLYRRPVPTIEEFLDGNYYLGLQNGTLYPFWRKKLCEIFAPDSIIKRVLWSGATGTGKGLLLDEVIPTPTGYIKVKDLKVNDYLWGKNGKPTKILKIFDRGLQDIYKISFDDGSSVTCDGDHLWQIDTYKRTKLKTPKIISTKDLFVTGIEYQTPSEHIKRYKFKIPVCNAVEYTEKEYKIHPYILGILLGDGCFSLTPIITNHIKDQFIIKKVRKHLSDDYILQKYSSNDPLHKNIIHYGIVRKDKTIIPFDHYYKELGLFQIHSHTKFIPNIYKFGSIKQRYELLRGLLDTDGTIQCQKNRKVSSILYSTISLQLAKDVTEIVRSLGGRAKISQVNRTNPRNKKDYIQYTVIISCLLNPFTLPRKANLFNIKKIQSKVITNIKKLDIQQNTRCFVVDAEDHLFLCNDYIVTHNTVTARKAVIYSLYKLLCLRYPRAVLNVEQGSTLAVFILSVTQKNAYQTNFQPMINILSNMPCFQHVRNMTAFENFDVNNPNVPIPFYVDKANLTINFIDNIILTVGSQISNTVGYDIVISAADEINECGVEEGMELLNSIDGRLDSRFGKSCQYTFQNVMSSARAKNSVTGEYNKKWQHDPSFLYLHPMRFEVKQSVDFAGTGENFPVLVGNGSIPSKIITDPGELLQIEKNELIVPSGCELVKVPMIYKPLFEADLEQQIQDTLGISTQDTPLVFRDTTLLEDPLLVPELTIEANLKENTNIFDCLPLNQLFIKDGLKDEYRLKRYPNADRYMHFDLSSSGECDTGICMGHKEYKINEITREKEIIYVTDFIIYVTAKNMTDLEAVQNFAMELVTRGHVPIHTISCDQFQSALVLNTWEQCGYFQKVEKVSVDTKLDPYLNAAALIESGKVKVGQCEKLKKELEALIIDKGKVTRTTQLKDGADVLVGMIFNAQMNYTDVPQNEYYDKIEMTKDTNYNDLIDVEQEELVDL